MKRFDGETHTNQETDFLTDDTLRDYLLGRLQATDAERIEAQVIQSQDVFERAQSVEDDLFDDYARGRLAPADRDRFLARFSHKTDRLAAAHAFAARIASDEDTRAVSGSPSAWGTLAIAASLVIAVTAILVIGLRRQDAPTVAEAPARIASMPPAVAMLTLGTSRGARAPTYVSVPKGASVLQLRVRLNPADAFDRYAMTLRSSTDRIVWTADNLRTTASGADLLLIGDVPVATIEGDTFELAVRGGGEELGFVSLQVARTP